MMKTISFLLLIAAVAAPSCNASESQPHMEDQNARTPRSILKKPHAHGEIWERKVKTSQKVQFDEEALLQPEEPVKNRTNKRFKKIFGCTPPGHPGFRVLRQVGGEFHYRKQQSVFKTIKDETFQVLSTAGEEHKNALKLAEEVKSLWQQEDAPVTPHPIPVAKKIDAETASSTKLGEDKNPAVNQINSTVALSDAASSTEDDDHELEVFLRHFEQVDGHSNPSIALPQTRLGAIAAPFIGLNTVTAIGAFLGYHYH